MVSLGPPNVVVQTRDHQCIVMIKPSTKQAIKQDREREGRVEANRRAELTLIFSAESARIYTERE